MSDDDIVIVKSPEEDDQQRRNTEIRILRNSLFYRIGWWILLVIAELEGFFGGLAIFAPKSAHLAAGPSPYFDFGVVVVFIALLAYVGHRTNMKEPGERLTRWVQHPAYWGSWSVVSLLGLGWGVVLGASLLGYGIQPVTAIFGFLAITLAFGATLFVAGRQEGLALKRKPKTNEPDITLPTDAVK